MNERKTWRGRIRLRSLLCVLACLCFLLPFRLFNANEGGMYEVNASAASGDLIEIQKLDVKMTVLESREIEVRENITVKFLAPDSYDLTMFYRSLPTKGCRYTDIVATCANNPHFQYEVVDNPDLDGFIDVECIGGVAQGKVWTYQISYIMMPETGDGFPVSLNVVGHGWSVPLHNVTAKLYFPATPTIDSVFVGGFGTTAQGEYSLVERVLTVEKDYLPLVYNSTYGEYMAEGITVEFTLPDGVLVDYTKSRFWTDNMTGIMIGGGVTIAAGVLFFLFRKKREIVTFVNVKPPEGMSPLQMGKILDGTADNEDVTSMIYYFANKGYLKIKFEDEDDPELIRLVPALPETSPIHEKTLFDGLFCCKAEGESGAVKISELATNYYQTSEAAKKQVLAPSPMYERGSKWAFFSGGVIGLLYAFLSAFFVGKRVGGGYNYFSGLFFLLPIAITLSLEGVRENYRYKWKSSKLFAFRVGAWAVNLLFLALVLPFMGEHVMTGWEKLFLCLGALIPPCLTANMLVRTEKYANTLGAILGFKEFIVVTEEEKIHFMLQENPELYYDVLPYAQVLGVTDEWEKKFEKITLEPPVWYAGGNLTLFDHYIISRCVTRSMIRTLTQAAINASGGGHIGRSGGGGFGGGFGGGGFGGGGGGAR